MACGEVDHLVVGVALAGGEGIPTADAREADERPDVAFAIGRFVGRYLGVTTVLHVFEGQVCRVGLGGLPAELQFAGEHIGAADLGAITHQRVRGDDRGNASVVGRSRGAAKAGEGAARGLVVGVEAFAGVLDDGQTCREGVAHGYVQCELQFLRVRIIRAELAVVAFDVAEELAEYGLLGGERDGATGGVLAEQRALRAAEDFDLLEVEHLDELRLHVVEGEVIDRDTDRGVFGDQNRDESGTAHTAADRVEAYLRGQDDVGRHLAEGRDVMLEAVLDLLGGQGGDGDREILLGHAALGAGDDDLFDAEFARGFLCPCERAAQKCRDHDAGSKGMQTEGGFDDHYGLLDGLNLYNSRTSSPVIDAGVQRRTVTLLAMNRNAA